MEECCNGKSNCEHFGTKYDVILEDCEHPEDLQPHDEVSVCNCEEPKRITVKDLHSPLETKRIITREVCRAFMFESGRPEDMFNDELLDWMGVMLPKMQKELLKVEDDFELI